MGDKKGRNWIPILIEVAIVFTALPRWIPALMKAEGYDIPVEWLPWWRVVSAIFNGGMGFAEAVAFAYLFHVWSRARGSERRSLLILTILMLLTFSMVITPYVSAAVAGAEMSEVILNPQKYGIMLLWGASVVLSTGLTAMAVGVAQGANTLPVDERANKLLCWCGYAAKDESNLDEHNDTHLDEIFSAGSNQEAVAILESTYKDSRNQILPPVPGLAEIIKMKAKANKRLEEFKDE